MLILASMLVGCGNNEGGSADVIDMPTVGIVQIVEHPSLDTIRESILTQLAEEGFVDGETIWWIIRIHRMNRQI